MKNGFKNNIGITLVALIITIIVLLILAGVTLNLVIGENGIISKAKQGVSTYKKSAENELNQLDELYDEFTNMQQPQFTTVSNAPDISKFNKNNIYYVSWDTTSSPYRIIERAVATEIAPSNWYDYTAGVNHWANIKTTGGGNDCYWVWIPRYAYKVPNKSSKGEKIEVKFLQGKTKKPIGETEEIINTVPTPGTWVIHPAFTNAGNGGLGELEGIWVAKYEASSSQVGEINLRDDGVLEGDTGSLIGSGGGLDTNLHVRVKPNVTSWRGIDASNIFELCKNITKDGNSLEGMNVDSHMMKNIEWGACAYLSSSKYGKTDEEGNRKIVYNNPYYNDTTNYSIITGLSGDTAEQKNEGITNNLYVYNTDEGVEASTTGNVYGIYDMAGGEFEYTAGIYTDASDNENVKKLLESDSKYVDKYTKNTGEQSTYYGNIEKYGDAIYETSNSGNSYTGSWDDTLSMFPTSSEPAFRRGGRNGNGAGAGIFSYLCGTGARRAYVSFRPVFCSR